MLNLKRPHFWKYFNLVSLVLLPLSWVYYVIGWFRYILSAPKAVHIPVICVGNVVVGGAGKTPIVTELAKFLQCKGKKVAIITRGYRGSLSKHKFATCVKNHLVSEVGDEALILSKIVPTYINANRFIAAKKAEEEGAEIIIMDDGLQNYSLKKDFSILVIDGLYGFGNGKIFPAGPLREPLNMAIAKSDCIVTTQDKDFSIQSSLPQFQAGISIKNKERFLNKTFIALCGIASPEKFFATLEQLNIKVYERFIFGDHHYYKAEELEIIFTLAKKLNIKVVTTTKDMVKIPACFLPYIECVDIEYILPSQFFDLLLKKVAYYKEKNNERDNQC